MSSERRLPRRAHQRGRPRLDGSEVRYRQPSPRDLEHIAYLRAEMADRIARRDAAGKDTDDGRDLDLQRMMLKGMLTNYQRQHELPVDD